MNKKERGKKRKKDRVMVICVIAHYRRRFVNIWTIRSIFSCYWKAAIDYSNTTEKYPVTELNNFYVSVLTVKISPNVSLVNSTFRHFCVTNYIWIGDFKNDTSSRFKNFQESIEAEIHTNAIYLSFKCS